MSYRSGRAAGSGRAIPLLASEAAIVYVTCQALMAAATLQDGATANTLQTSAEALQQTIADELALASEQPASAEMALHTMLTMDKVN